MVLELSSVWSDDETESRAHHPLYVLLPLGSYHLLQQSYRKWLHCCDDDGDGGADDSCAPMQLTEGSKENY